MTYRKSEEKRPTSETQEDVPGVRGPTLPSGAEPPSPEQPGSWGGEGGAGTYGGGPVHSDVKRKPRRDAA